MRQSVEKFGKKSYNIEQRYYNLRRITMKNKILKIVTVILLLATLTVTNFIYVGTGLISYAIDSITTNHENVEFEAQLKEENI